MNPYQATADALVQRILELAKTKPEIATLKNPFELFRIGLNLKGLEPSMFQAEWALRKAQEELNAARQNTLGR